MQKMLKYESMEEFTDITEMNPDYCRPIFGTLLRFHELCQLDDCLDRSGPELD